MRLSIRCASPGGGAIEWEDVESQISDAMATLLRWANNLRDKLDEIHGSTDH